MRTSIQSQATNVMFVLNNYAGSTKSLKRSTKEKLSANAQEKNSIIESITETMVEPIVFIC